MKHVTIFRDTNFYPSHGSICIAGNGDLLTVFRQAPFEHVFSHVDPRARIDMVRSTDMGETWDPATRTTVYDPGDEINLNDPSITTLRDGTLIVTAFNSHAPWTKDTEKWGDKIIDVRGENFYYVPSVRWIVVMRSFDNGVTWDGPYTVDASAYSKTDAAVFASVVELADGKILMPISVTDHDTGRHVAALVCSTDKGKTWGPYAEITSWSSKDPDTMSFGLPTVVAYDDNHLIAAGWTGGEVGTLVSESHDAGKTWSPVRKVVSKGECTHVSVTNRGTTILTYGYRTQPFGIRVWPSYDKGQTWKPGDAAALRSDGAMRDLGYPRTIQLPNGKLLTIYYFNIDDKDRSYYDEEKSLEVCKAWNLNPPLYTYQTAGLRFIGGTIYTEDEMAELAGTATFEPKPGEAGPTLL